LKLTYALAAAAVVFASPAFALDSDVSMKSTLSADAVWKKVGAFCDIGKWHPIFASCTLSADGKERSLVAKNGATATEHLESRDDSARTYTYTIVGGTVPIANYRSTISVTPDGAGSTIHWTGKYDAKGAPDADVKDLIDTIYSTGEKALATP
jgi:hypothetical protein